MSGNLRRALCALLLTLIALPAWAILPIQHWQTKGGARVYFVEARNLPMLDISVDFPAGSAYDTPEKSGVASMTQGMLRLGAGGLSEDEFARRMADTGAQLGGRIDSDRAGVTLRTLSSADERAPSLKLFALALQKPEFPASVIEREKKRLVDAIKESDTKPETIMSRTFSRLAYARHPYGLRTSGEVNTVEGITRNDLVAFYRRYYTSDNAIVAIIGDVSRAEAEAIAEQVTGELPRADSTPSIPPVPSLQDGSMRVIAHPASQSHLILGMPGIKRSDPDYFPLFVGNYILGGGGFESRMMEEVRSKRGLAYSAYSYFSPMQERGPFVIGLQTRKDQAAEALAVVRSTLKDFLEKGPTERELQNARQNLVGGFPLRIDSNRKILDYLAVIGFYHLPLTYLEDFVPSVEKVTIADIRAAFAKRVDPAHMATVIVGADAKTIEGASAN